MTELLALHAAEETLDAVHTRRHASYPAYKPSGVEWLGDVPEYWDVLPVRRRAIRIQTGSTPPTQEDRYYENGTVPWYGPSSFSYNVSVGSAVKRVALEAIKDGVARMFSANSVLVVTIGATLGKVAWLPQDGSTNQQITAITFDERNVVGKYVAFQLKLIERRLRNIAPSATLPILDTQEIASIPIALPSLKEQQAIARFLDEQTQKIDDLIEAKQGLLDLLKEKRQAAITHAVTRGLDPAAKLKPSGVEWLGDVPEHWAPKKLGYLACMQGGSTPNKSNEEFWNGSIPWVSPKDMKSLIIKGSIDHISESALEETNLKLIDPPAVLMVVRGMILAHSFPVGITTTPVTINQDMKALTPRDGISSEYLLHLLNGISKVALGTVNDSAHGTRVLRLPFWKHITVHLPEKQEQKKICEYINTAHDKYDRMIAEVQTAIDCLHEYRISIISAAVTGKIDVRGATVQTKP